jgi:hypothetical protein
MEPAEVMQKAKERMTVGAPTLVQARTTAGVLATDRPAAVERVAAAPTEVATVAVQQRVLLPQRTRWPQLLRRPRQPHHRRGTPRARPV